MVTADTCTMFYSVMNSTGATQRFSTNHKMSSEQNNLSLFISDQGIEGTLILLFCPCLVIGGKMLGGPS